MSAAPGKVGSHVLHVLLELVVEHMIHIFRLLRSTFLDYCEVKTQIVKVEVSFCITPAST